MVTETALLQIDWRKLIMAPSKSVVAVTDAPGDVPLDAWGQPIALRDGQDVLLYAAETDETGVRDDLLFAGVAQFDVPPGRWTVSLDNTCVRRRSSIEPEEPHWANAVDWDAVYATEAGRRGKHGPRREILVVDDDQGVLQMLTSVLEQWGYQVRTAANGREAINELERSPADLVLLDAVMPEMDGAAFLLERRQREVLSEVPTVVISGFPDIAKAATTGLGTEGFLAKPFGLEELMRTLQRVTASRSA